MEKMLRDVVRGSKKPSVGLKELLKIEAVKILESGEMASLDSPTTVAEHDFLRPNFTLRLKPTTAVNAGDKLKLEVRFIAQPEPTVNRMFTS